MRNHSSPPSGPPYPRKVRFWQRLHARLAGRRDSRSGAVHDIDGHLPFTRELAADGHRGQTGIDDWLHGALTKLDATVATILETIADSRRAIGRVDQRIDHIESETTEPGSERAIRNARELTRLRAGRSEQGQRASEAASQLARLLSDRRHTIDRAHASADAWETRFHRLAHCHRRGYDRRRRASAEPAPVPAFPTFVSWRGDSNLPLLAPLIDPDAREIVEIALRPFDTRLAGGDHRSTSTSSEGSNQMKDFTVRCPTCKGTGKNPSQKFGFSICPKCRGKGTIKKG